MMFSQLIKPLNGKVVTKNPEINRHHYLEIDKQKGEIL
jgi:hypothetical protein